jgi:glycine oxidase
LLFPQDGQIDNRRRLMRALERACVNRGVRFEEGSELLELITAPGGAETAAGRQLQAVRLRRADGQELTLPCAAAVLACCCCCCCCWCCCEANCCVAPDQ